MWKGETLEARDIFFSNKLLLSLQDEEEEIKLEINVLKRVCINILDRALGRWQNKLIQMDVSFFCVVVFKS